MKYSVLLVVIFTTSAISVPNGRFVPQLKSRFHQLLAYNKTNYSIFNANETDITNYPYTVSVYSKTFDALIGSGTILNHNWILVTGFEIVGLSADDIIVTAGSNFSDCDGQEFNVSRIVVNEYFDSQYWSDIALLKTESKIVYSDTVKRINLSYYTPGANTTAVISGFGGNDEESGVLRSSTVTILSDSICKRYFSDPDESWLCAFSNTSALSAFDDFGNPLVQKKVLVGIYLGTVENGPDIFSNIFHWKDWIVENIKKYNT